MGLYAPGSNMGGDASEISFYTHQNFKGAGLFQRAGRTKEQAGGRGTSRYPNGIKS